MPGPIGCGYTSHSSVIRTPYPGVLSLVIWIKPPAHAGCLLEFTTRFAPGSGPGCYLKIPRGPAGERLLK